MKKFSKIVTGFMLVLSLVLSSIVFVGAKSQPLYGDVNLDGEITIADVTKTCKYLAEADEFTDEQLELADYNGDSTVNIDDATDMQQMIADLDYDYTHELYDIEYKSFDAEGLTPVAFNVDKNERADIYGPDNTADFYYSSMYGGMGSVVNLFNTREEYARFFKSEFEEYDESFFEEKSLIFLYEFCNSGSRYFTLDNVYSSDGVMYLEITKWSPSSGIFTDDIAMRNQFISVDKSELGNIDKICVKTNYSEY